jgi:Transmembrane amino acid transporter protein
MISETISLGILSLPSALSTLGLIPGLTLLLTLGALATHTAHIHSMGDAGAILFGQLGGWVLGAGQLAFVVFIMGSHVLTFGIMMNAITGHAACTVVFMLAGTVLSFVLAIPRTLKNLSWWSITSFVSIVAAVVVTMVGVATASPHDSSGSRNGDGGILAGREFSLWPAPDVQFHTAFLAVSNIIFAYAGHVAFFTFISELREPREFPKALALLQVSDICMYVVSAVVIYYYAGGTVKSPALDSAGPVVRKVAYGVAIPTIVIAGVVNGHVAVKYLYVRICRYLYDKEKGKMPGGKRRSESGSGSGVPGGSSSTESSPSTIEKGAARPEPENLLYSTSWKARGLWIAINGTLWLAAWLIAEGVPVFNDLLGLTSALFASWFTFGLSGCMWFSMQFEGVRERGTWMGCRGLARWRLIRRGLRWRNVVGAVVAAVCFAVGLAIVSASSLLSFPSRIL